MKLKDSDCECFVKMSDKTWRNCVKLVGYKGGFKSENVEGFSNLPKNIPRNYLKFVHPVHDIDKTSILNFFDFTSLTYLQVVQKGF